jgi:hypothetical protein
MFESFFGGKKKATEEEAPVLPDKAELAARAAENGGGKAEFSLGEDLTEVKKQQAEAKSGWNASMRTARDEAVFQKEGRGGAPIEYDAVDMDDDQENKAA